MGRRNSGVMDDVFSLCMQMPWWVGVLVAVVIWTIGFLVSGGGEPSSFKESVAPIMSMVFGVLALTALVGALASAIRGVSRRRLLDRQKGVESLRSLSWREFEQLVGEAYRRRGYSIEERGGSGADGGVDLVLYGQGETVLVQCKQWRAQQVGVSKVRELFGVVTAAQADRGVLVTSGRFTRDAQTFALGKGIDLVDGQALAKLVQGVQHKASATAEMKLALDSPALTTCPLCGSRMVLRTARRGANAGSQFYGCSRFPDCRGTRKA